MIFEGVPFDVITTLINKGYLRLEDYRYSRPEMSELIMFAMKHKPENWRFRGHAVDAERNDEGIVIEGIRSIKPLDKDDLIDFLQEFRLADELIVEDDNTVDCWFN